MIFCTVGTQLPFDRLLKAVDDVAKSLPDEEFFAQIGESVYVPTNLIYERSLDEMSYHSILKKSKVIIGHAGMGTIISALEYQLPLIIVPRLFKYGEHRNDHQVATVSKFGHYPGIFVCEDLDNLSEVICKALSFCDEGQLETQSSDLSFKIKNIIDVLLEV